jgi:putative lipoprotein
MASPGNPPIAITIAYDSSKIAPDHRYVVRARILVDDRQLIATDTATPVITRGSPVTVSLMLRRVGTGQTSPGSCGSRPLEGTYWKAIELAGKPTPTQDPTREAHLQFQGGRVSGSDCNRITGSYQLSGDRITFGPIAGTQMVCLNPSGTEGPLRDALKSATKLTVAGDRLDYAMRRERGSRCLPPAVKRWRRRHRPASPEHHGSS